MSIKDKKTLSTLPPDIIARIFDLLPISSIPDIACVSRRFKIIVNGDNMYEPKLRMLGIKDVSLISNEDVKEITDRLKRIPGGNLLPGGRRYLESNIMHPIKKNDSFKEESLLASPGLQGNNIEQGTQPETTGEHQNDEPKPLKKNIVIGAGGLRAMLLESEDQTLVKTGAVRQVRSSFSVGVSKRETFKKIILELKSFYFDFRRKQKESKLFKEYTDSPEISIILHRLAIVHKCGFWENTQEIGFNISSAQEWYQAILLGRFEQAYDINDVGEMRKAALALYNLDVGEVAVQLFVAKNPIFFDATYNPTLVLGKLSTNGNSLGYSLANEFAEFMEFTISSCQRQIDIIAQVFVPELDAMTTFVNKVFEESIGEYLGFVLKFAKESGSTKVYLHTLASSVYCCTQFLDYLNKNGQVDVNTELIKKSVIQILKQYTDKYINLEVEVLQKQLIADVQEWDKLKCKLEPHVIDYLQDQEKAIAHKRAVMKRFKKVIFAPIKLTTNLASNTMNLFKLQKKSARDDTTPIVDQNSTQNVPTSEEVSGSNEELEAMSSLLSLDLCMKLLQKNKDALGRTLVITYAVDKNRIRSNVEKVFICLLRVIGEHHLKPSFKIALERLDKSQPIEYSDDNQSMINQDALQFFELVHLADLIQQMIEVYFSEDIKPWIDEADFLSDISVEKKAFERFLDEQVAMGMDKAAQTTINQVEYILLKEHVVADYNPSNDNKIYDLKATKGCDMAIACLKSNVQLLTGATDKSTLEVFLGEIGARLFTTLIKHMKHIVISPSGAMRLICDLNTYCEYAGSLRVNSVSKAFTVLKEIGYLFIVDGPQELKELVYNNQKYHGILTQDEILELVASRSDYKNIKKFVESKECIIQ